MVVSSFNLVPTAMIKQFTLSSIVNLASPTRSKWYTKFKTIQFVVNCDKISLVNFN